MAARREPLNGFSSSLQASADDHLLILDQWNKNRHAVVSNCAYFKYRNYVNNAKQDLQ
jgi:hypothetical protein